MSKNFTRYDSVAVFVRRAHEISSEEYWGSIQKPPKKATARKIRDQYLHLMRQPGAYMYTLNPWATKEMDPDMDIYVKGKWIITNSGGSRHEVPWQVAKAWLKSGILFRNAHGFALREGRPVFDVKSASEED